MANLFHDHDCDLMHLFSFFLFPFRVKSNGVKAKGASTKWSGVFWCWCQVLAPKKGKQLTFFLGLCNVVEMYQICWDAMVWIYWCFFYSVRTYFFWKMPSKFNSNLWIIQNFLAAIEQRSCLSSQTVTKLKSQDPVVLWVTFDCLLWLTDAHIYLH